MEKTSGRPIPQQRPTAIPLEEITRLVTIASEMKHHEDCKTVLDYLLELLVFEEVSND